MFQSLRRNKTMLVLFISASALLAIAIANTVFAQTLEKPPKATFLVPPNTWTYFYTQAPNSILHWTRNAFFSSTNSIDPAGNQIITEDHWVKTGSDGLPSMVRYRSSFSNGNLYQDLLITPDTSIVVLGPAYASTYHQTPTTYWCVEQAKRPTHSIPSAYLPLFVNESQLSAKGFAHSPALAHPVPSTSDVEGVSPVKLYSPINNPQTWSANYVNTQHSATEQLHYDVTADGLATSYGTRFLDTKTNAIAQEEWYTQGQINFYPLTSAVPSWVFQQPGQVTKGCNP